LERKLVREAQRGSAEAVARLYSLHWPRAHRAAFLVVHDAAAAEDLAQDAFLTAIDSLDRFDRRRPFGPWLHRIVANRAIDWARRETLRRKVGEPDDVAAETPPEQIGDDVMMALSELPCEQRAVVVLRYLLDYTPGEIAGMLELPRGTVQLTAAPRAGSTWDAPRGGAMRGGGRDQRAAAA
jgi:RNA polymerase sigma-70 factor, ECF subfamily